MASRAVLDRIDALEKLVERLNDSSSLEDVNSCLIELEYCRSRLSRFPEDEQEDYGLKLISLRDKIYSFSRNVFNKQTVALAIDPASLELGEELGRGSYGIVYRGRMAGTPVAVKKIRGRNSAQRKATLAEAALASKLSNASIVRFMGATVDKDDIVIVSELCDTDLKNESRSGRGRDPLAFVRNCVKWFCQAARGLTWMHDVCFMVHRDIKPANILLKKGDALVTDFGFTKALDSSEAKLLGTDGSPYYKAPEILNKQFFSFPVDVYAFGVTMYEVLFGNYPYDSSIKSEEQLRVAVTSGTRPNLKALERLGLPYPKSLIDLMQDCWEGDPEKRPKMAQVFERLKGIYVETFAAADSPTYEFWLNNFGDDISDHARLTDVLKKMPGYGTTADRYRCALLCVPSSVPDDYSVSIQDLNNLVYWYGDWFKLDILSMIVQALSSNRWLVGYVDRSLAEKLILDQYTTTGRSCFLVRASKTNPYASPFTITLYDNGIQNHRILRTPEGILSCPSLGSVGSSVVHDLTVFGLINKLQENDALTAQPFGGVVDAGGVY